MTLLLDTSALIWWLNNDVRLGKRARRDIANSANQVFNSDIALLELAIKLKTGKLRMGEDFTEVARSILHEGFQETSFDAWCGQQFMDMPELSWADPFDRAHMAMAIAKKMTLVTADANIIAAQIGGLHIMDARL